jgi:hypothetical protein
MYPEFNIGHCVYSLHPCGHNLVEIRWGMIIGITCKVVPKSEVITAPDLVCDIVEIIYNIAPFAKNSDGKIYLDPEESCYQSSDRTFDTPCDAKEYLESLAHKLVYED